MIQLVMGVFIILHGLVYVLYLGQSQKFFELQPGMIWPEGSWALSRLFGNDATRLLAGIACGLAALGFAASGSGILLGQSWWRSAITVVAAFSCVALILLWNGKMQRLDNQGAIGVLINIALIVAALRLQLPELEF